MQYREFGNLGFKSSILGFGTMRLPIIDNQPNKINESEAIRMIRYAIDQGVNYIDTAYMYHNGKSEEVVGKALKDGYREKVVLADKMPVWYAKEAKDLDTIFNTQLERLDVDCIDLYLLHSVNKFIWKRAKKFGIVEFLNKLKKEGKVKHIGFSFHDDLEFFKEVIDEYDWEFCQIQLNYIDTEYQAGLEGLKYASSKGLPVVIMEPLKGGRLAVKPPKSVQNIWDEFDIKRTPAHWALKWICNFPEVNVILSGMNNMEQTIENINIIENALPNSMSDKELELIEKAKNQYKKLIKIDCTACNYCMPCPSKVNIPKNFMFYNEMFLYETPEVTKADYNMFLPPKTRASACIQCGKCEEVCPQHLPIINYLKDVTKMFES